MRLAVACVIFASVAYAQPNAPADVAYQEGRRLYDLREFDAAIAKFKEAYRLRTDAASLFNIAQSYRLLGDCPNAHAYYKTFQRNYPDERAEVVTKFIADLEPCATVTPVPSAAPVSSEPSEPARRERARSSGRALRTSGISVGAAGIALVGTGVAFGVRARTTSRDLDSSAVWDPTLDEQARRADRLAKGFLVGGGVALIGGGVLYWLGHRASSSTVAVVPTSEGATLVWAGGF